LVKHMVDLMRDTGGIVEHINPFKLSGMLEDAITEKKVAPPPDEPVKKIEPKRKPTKPRAKKAGKKKA